MIRLIVDLKNLAYQKSSIKPPLYNNLPLLGKESY